MEVWCARQNNIWFRKDIRWWMRSLTIGTLPLRLRDYFERAWRWRPQMRSSGRSQPFQQLTGRPVRVAVAPAIRHNSLDAPPCLSPATLKYYWCNVQRLLIERGFHKILQTSFVCGCCGFYQKGDTGLRFNAFHRRAYGRRRILRSGEKDEGNMAERPWSHVR